MKYQNTSSETRRWTGIQRPDGRGLELEPGETADLAAGIVDEYLRPAEPTPDLQSLTRDGLNDLAAQAGVTDPHLLPNKLAVIDAINVATAPDDPAETDTDPTDPGEQPDDTAPEKAPQNTDQPGVDAPAEE